MTSISPTYDPHLSERKTIDEEIATLEAQIRELKTARNRLAPIARLHPEILQEIFFLAHYTSPFKGKATLLLTWVSRRWRELALDTPSLWSQIDFRCREWVEVALSRTKNRELEFDLLNITESGTKDLTPLIPFTLANLSRIRILKIISRYRRGTMVLPVNAPEWLFPAPLLVDLCFRGLTLPPNLFSGVTPRLQSLDLESCSLNWKEFPIPSGLKRLSLAVPIQYLPDLEDIARILYVSSPTLEELELQNILSYHQSEPVPIRIDKICLNKLKFIRLEEDFSNRLPLLLEFIALPPRVIIEIALSQCTEMSPFHALIAARSIERRPVVHLEIKFEGFENKRVTFRAMEDWSTTTENLIDISSNRQTHIQFDIIEVGEASELLPMFHLLPQPIERLSFSGVFYKVYDTTIVDYFGRLGTVRELHIELPFLSPFLASINIQNKELGERFEEDLDRLIMIDPDARTDTQTGSSSSSSLDPEKKALAQASILFHNLRSLEIHGDSYPVFDFTGENASVLQTWLEWRNRFDLRLEVLQISRLNSPSAGWMEGVFEGLVDKVETGN